MDYFKMTKLLLLFLLGNSLCMNAQKVLPFVGFGYNINTAFESGGYGNVETGVQYAISKYIKPEVSLRFFVGSLQDKTTTDFENDFKPLKEVHTSFESVTLSFTPNFTIPLGADAIVELSIKPRFNHSIISAKEVVYVYQNDKPIRNENTRKGINNSFGISVGVLGKFVSKSSDALAISLFTDNFDFNKVIKSDNNFEVNTRYDLGAEIIYYINLSKKKK